jgi:hypothetical protein
MLNVFDEATNAMRRAVKDQMDKLLADIEATVNGLMKGQMEFDSEMDQITKNREALSERERRARTKLKAATQDASAVLISIQNQVNAGVMHTGGETLDQSLESKTIGQHLESLQKGNGNGN